MRKKALSKFTVMQDRIAYNTIDLTQERILQRIIVHIIPFCYTQELIEHDATSFLSSFDACFGK